MIRNVHERVINAPLEPLGVLLDGLGQKDDRLWPSRYWPPMVLDRPLALGADGGHDGIYYYVSEYEPGRRVRFSFRTRTGIIGAHGFEPIEGTPVGADVFSEMLRSHDDGLAEFLDLARVKPNTLGNACMLLHL